MTTNDLIQRCAAFGWTLRPEGEGYELLGNGAPAAFRSADSLVAWLEKQERAQPPALRAPVQLDDYRQASLFDEAA
jgi:hypothetical protein